MYRVTDKKYELRAKTFDYGLKYPIKASDDLEDIREAYARFVSKWFYDIRLLVDWELTDLSFLELEGGDRDLG